MPGKSTTDAGKRHVARLENLLDFLAIAFARFEPVHHNPKDSKGLTQFQSGGLKARGTLRRG
jgi:hypothetical protein